MKTLKAALYELGLLYNQKISDEVIEAYTKFLKDYEPDSVIVGIKKIIKKGSKFFPTCPELISEIEDYEGNSFYPSMGASHIIKTAKKIGYYDKNKGWQELNDVEKEALEQYGGFYKLGQSENINITHAQLTKIIMAIEHRNENEKYKINKNKKLIG